MMMKSTSSVEDKTPKELVELLEECGGDLTKFAEAWAPGEDKLTVTMRAEVALVESSKDYLKWNQLIHARNQARFKLAQQKAFEAIGNYEIPADENGKTTAALTTMLSYMRFWFSAESVGQQTRARKDAQSTAGNAEIAALEELFDGLTGG